MRRRQPLKSNKLKKWLAAPYAVWAAGFIIIPLILILYYAFTGEEGGFTLSNFAYVATKENIKALGLALWLSLLSTVLCLVLAYPLAMILANRNVNQTSFIVLIFILPMWMNFLLRTLAWQTLLEKNGVINSILSVFPSARHFHHQHTGSDHSRYGLQLPAIYGSADLQCPD